MNSNSPQLSERRLLAVLAHPDDESFGPGGTLAFYARQGVEVFLVCATRGEAGEVDEDCLDGFTSIAERREEELRCAAQHLGLSGVFFLGYHDSGMPGSMYNQHPDSMLNRSEEEIAGRVVEYIRMLRPQVVITFDPIGGYRHPDHIAIQKAATRAFHAAGDLHQYPGESEPYQPQKLYFHIFSKRLLRLAVRVLPLFRRDPHKFGRNGDIDLVSLVSDDFPTHAVINYRPVLQRQMDASACHDSQGGRDMRKGGMGLARRLAGSKDTFMRAYPPFESEKLERDLFSGVV
jgi:mycothiol S-conjugate amidase